LEKGCRVRHREGWTLVATHSDAARSGASRLRPGYQRLLEDARAGAFDAVVAETLDRLSRDQEDIAALDKRLRFRGVRILTLGRWRDQRATPRNPLPRKGRAIAYAPSSMAINRAVTARVPQAGYRWR
jgi:hypothetical protein